MPAPGCPSAVAISTYLGYLEGFFRLVRDSDLRARAIDGFNASVPTRCLGPNQARRLLALTSRLQAQAAAEEASFQMFGSGIGGLVTRLAVGALGASLVIVGLIMIATDVTLGAAAGRFGKELRGVVRR